jgi:hypothetical protein
MNLSDVLLKDVLTLDPYLFADAIVAAGMFLVSDCQFVMVPPGYDVGFR